MRSRTVRCGNWCWTWTRRSGGFARLDNLFDRRHIGSVIVNEGNGRFYEPGLGRQLTVGLQWNWDRMR